MELNLGADLNEIGNVMFLFLSYL